MATIFKYFSSPRGEAERLHEMIKIVYVNRIAYMNQQGINIKDLKGNIIYSEQIGILRVFEEIYIDYIALNILTQDEFKWLSEENILEIITIH